MQPLEQTAPRAELAIRWTADRLVDALELERGRWPVWFYGVRVADPRLGDVPGSDLSAIVQFGENRRSICVRIVGSRRTARRGGPPALVVRGSCSRRMAARTVVAGLRVMLREAYQRAAVRGHMLEMPADVARGR